MGLKVYQYPVSVCTACWNNDFDIRCSGCRSDLDYTSNVGMRGYVQAPIIHTAFSNLKSYREQIEAVKQEFYKNYTIEQFTVQN